MSLLRRLALSAALTSACGSDEALPDGSTTVDAAPVDSSPDAVEADAAEVDANVLDASVTDASVDTPIDAASVDTPVDAPVDAVPLDVPDISGTFLLAVRAGFETSGNPSYYFQFLVTWTLDRNAATLSGSYVPLCVAETGCTTYRSQVPPPIASNGTIVTTEGLFSQPLVGTLPGLANPFSGTSQPMNFLLSGDIVSTDLACGTVTGTAAGLDMTGSTFAAQRVTDTSPGALPAPMASCP